ncbi:hypothetical protein NO559_11125 [Dasania sp. GY-MA-18]|uniref:Uncharacterized protein n=1 Tax=Dasania phycosphaerae TaxID=2950436 RepID=A0A9J6RN73_9GAMM|nr:MULTISPECIES: hypothetical protein [Dasania]MCR8923329.1 hypothetical protein [Dasania sp. GY-MA-18]MCZ0865761.1 hypothetical protein [Dasania phycosphaerae]MCZ0869486.1 hypothetical protein [Dasania phycosphaerae]
MLSNSPTQFLCSTHKAHSLSSARLAISYWEIWMADGQALYQSGNWQQALSYYGCSFEVGEWLLQQLNENEHKNTRLNYAERMMLAGHSLAQCYKQMQHYSLELDILIRVHNHLSRHGTKLIGQHWLLDNYLAISLNAIQQFGSRKKSRPSQKLSQQLKPLQRSGLNELLPLNRFHWAGSH